MAKKTQDEIVNHLKNYGFVFPNSEIYNGLANGWDYGPLGVLLKQNIKNKWWKEFVSKSNDIYGLDSSIILNTSVWNASGHLSNFSDPLVDCKSCKKRYRADKLIEEQLNINVNENDPSEILKSYLEKINCPNCKVKNWTDIRNFNLMFKTFQGTVEDKQNELYLRPETAQGIFINFKNIQRTMRAKLPFGVAQIGKSFRNEITPGNFIFRTREFEQMEIEYFFNSHKDQNYFDKFSNKIKEFLHNVCLFSNDNIKLIEHSKEQLSHYSKRTVDFQYNFPHGFAELWGIANRGDYDLSQHMNYSKKDLSYLDEETNNKLIPHVIEPSVGVERLFYALVCEHYDVEQLENNEAREILRFPFWLSPYKIAILPLNNKLKDKANEIYLSLLETGINITYDSSGSIGKRYRRQDAIGTYFCVTIDFDTLEDNCVTIRNRDTMQQERIQIKKIIPFILTYQK